MGKRKSRPTPVLPEALPGLVDAHTHLYSCGHRTADEVRAAADRAALAGVAAMVTVGDDLAESEAVVAAAEADDRVYAAVAVHPTRAREATDPERGEQVRARLRELAAHPRVVAVGETGLDHYWVGKMDDCAEPAEQEESLRWHAGLAAELGKCLMIHNREADADLLRVLGEVAGPDSGIPHVMLHCFSSPLDVAEQALERGYVLSFTGNVTFKANEHLREAARLAPAGQLLVETDAPYMAPEPFRGARNEPGLVGYTARAIAAVRGQSPEEFVAEVADTARAVFGLTL
ncbi:TatD family hydrolase [Dietzia massiliensis]|uniref:TatD family hydrolase n=1 Tax=Dietzia massiliensis TaxID=2697499 RepID=UPI001BD00D31|nr:TatD family hydrolase [Dietzia massiliensis]MBS7547999.1 TatD family hydrolase [Dietzia massiliensis]